MSFYRVLNLSLYILSYPMKIVSEIIRYSLRN